MTTKPEFQNQPSHIARDSIRIVVADDHIVMRDGLCYILNAEPDFEIVGAAGNGLEVIELTQRLHPDVILMDLQMPQLNGVEAIRRLKAENNNLKIIILTTFSKDEYILEGIRAGAQGYLLKDVDKEELCQAIRLVSQGHSLTQPAITARLFNIITQGGPKPAEVSLTERELEVLRLLAHGDRNKEIALKLGIGENTIKGYITSIFQKLNVSDRTGAAIYAVQKGLIKLDEIE